MPFQSLMQFQKLKIHRPLERVRFCLKALFCMTQFILIYSLLIHHIYHINKACKDISSVWLDFTFHHFLSNFNWFTLEVFQMWDWFHDWVKVCTEYSISIVFVWKKTAIEYTFRSTSWQKVLQKGLRDFPFERPPLFYINTLELTEVFYFIPTLTLRDMERKIF